jgi:hypothetical protein
MPSSLVRLLPLLLTLASGPALAQPPSAGSVYNFRDPVFGGTVFCDTFEQVRDIAVSEIPNTIYALYRSTPNAAHEPICMAIAPSALVMQVTPVGVMKRDGDHYHAWVVKAQVGEFVAYALYLEEFEYVSI